jgi:putative ABC transport system ATP-binding protein
MIELRGVNRLFQVGDDLSIMGPSGSGKSTLLNIIGLLDHPDSGRYLLAGMDTTTLSEARKAEVRRNRVGFVFQTFHLVPRLTAAENVELPMMLAGIEPAERRARVAEALADLGLSDRAHHRPDQLSGGQRQRVAIARATIMRPDILLADEPTGNLDTQMADSVMELLAEINASGTTIIMVTHEPALADRAKRNILVRDGNVGDGHTELHLAEAASI